MREAAFAWVCELDGCGHRWLAKSATVPAACSKCRRRGWHKTKTTAELIRESGAGLDDRIAEIARRVFAEEWERVPVDPADTMTFAEPEILPPGRVDMAKLRDICAGNVAPNVSANVAGPMATPLGQPVAPLEPCGFESFNDVDGEVYRCSLPQHDFKVKHGGWVKV